MVLHSYDGQGFQMAHMLDESPDPFSFETHAHDVCEIYYFMAGRGYYTVEGANYPLEPGTLLLMREGELHALHIDPACRYERVTINFAYGTIDPAGNWRDLRALFYDRALGKSNMTRFRENAAYMRSLFDRLCQATALGDTAGGVEVRIYVAAILAEVIGTRRRDPHAADIPDNVDFSLKIHDVTKAEAKIVLEIIGYVNAHLFEIENLAEIEARFFFSRSYINRIFKSATGSSLWNYVLLKRLLAAQALLKSGTPAAVAASRCGFNDYSSFYKQYRNKLGIAPTCEKSSFFVK